MSASAFILIPLNTKIKPPLYETSSEWEESVMANGKRGQLCRVLPHVWDTAVSFHGGWLIMVLC